MTIALILFLCAAAGVGLFIAAETSSRSMFHGQWRERFRHAECGHVDQYAWDTCPKCGHAMHPDHVYRGGGEWETITCRATGLSGWEIKH